MTVRLASCKAMVLERSDDRHCSPVRGLAHTVLLLPITAMPPVNADAQAGLERSRRARHDPHGTTRTVDLFDAIGAGAVLGVRPKAVAVILGGLFPIMSGTGTGSEVMQPIAAPMVGGMITAPLLSMSVIAAACPLMRQPVCASVCRQAPCQLELLHPRRWAPARANMSGGRNTH
jgi:hypothetical protein